MLVHVHVYIYIGVGGFNTAGLFGGVLTLCMCMNVGSAYFITNPPTHASNKHDTPRYILAVHFPGHGLGREKRPCYVNVDDLPEGGDGVTRCVADA